MKHIAVVLILALLTGCGSGNSAPGTQSKTISGVTSRPGIVYLKDSSAKEISTDSAADGSYSLDTTGLQPPFMLKAVYNNNSTHYAITKNTDKIVDLNVQSTSLTQIAAAGLDLAVLYLTIKGDLLLILASLIESMAKAIGH